MDTLVRRVAVIALGLAALVGLARGLSGHRWLDAILSGLTVATINTNLGTLQSAFGLNRGAKLSQFLDGTSNTMIMAEYLTGTL